MAHAADRFQLSNEMILDGTKENPGEAPGPRDERRATIVAAARDAFFSNGYAGTSMSAIVATVGGSKTTMWSHFPSKESLFAAVVDDIVDQYGAALSVPMARDEPVVAALGRFAAAMMATILSEPIVALHRLISGEAGRFPELGRVFYERGPRRGKARLAAYIEDAMADGRLRPGDPMRAARQFASLCQSGVFQENLFGLNPPRDAQTIGQDITHAIDTFMRAWGPEA